MHWLPNRYPKARRGDHVDTYLSAKRGTVNVPDPYQWLEVNNQETDTWVAEQEKFTRSFLDENLDREKLANAIRLNTDYAKVCVAQNSAFSTRVLIQ